MSETTEVKRPDTLRNVAFIFLIAFLIVAMVAAGVAVVVGVSTARGVRAVSDPVGELVRQLVVDATPVILPNPVMIIEEINSLARLETASYSFQDILQIERNQDSLFGLFGESLLFVAYGDVIAGVDLSKMGTEDLQVVGPTKVIVRLPAAELFVTDLDNERSYVADRDIGLLTKGDSELETLIRQEADARMEETALSSGILDMADEEAQNVLRGLLTELGFEEIEFVEGVMPQLTPFVPEVPKGHAVTPVPTIIITPSPAS
ncbi:MAG: DUF4230 domain-containing protein [Chloroflexota bacterium]|nr:MAG: DUF4230 domain-containing protein [Chloroflexota bacterium]